MIDAAGRFTQNLLSLRKYACDLEARRSSHARLPAMQCRLDPPWRAYVVTSILEKPIACRHCGARLKLRRGALDVLPTLVVATTATLAHYLRAGPTGFVIWAMIMAAVAGLAIYASLVCYKVIDEPIKFTPHPSSPPRA